MSEARKMPVQLISVDAVVDAADTLARQILDSGFRPDTIIAIARGGFMPARFLCDFLQVHKLLSLKVEHYTSGARKKQAAAVVTVPLSGEVRGERVLLVDDVNDSGDTLTAARPYLETFKPEAVRTAVLHEKTTTTCPADFRSHTVREWRWLLYPWAVVEDVGQFIQQMDPPPSHRVELIERLRLDYSLELHPAELDRVIRYHNLEIG